MSTKQEDSFPSLGKVKENEPSADWTTDELGQYAHIQDELCAGLGRKMAVHRFREGHALTLAFEKIGYGRWTPFLKKHGVSHSSDDRARKLYARAKHENNLEGLAIMQAYEEFGIDRPRPRAKTPEGKVAAKPASTGKSENQKKCEPQVPADEWHTHDTDSPAPDDAEASSEAERILHEFHEFAAQKGWDEDRQIQVMAELSFSDPLRDMVNDIVKAGFGDGMLQQLHQYYADEPDYESWLTAKASSVWMHGIDQMVEKARAAVMRQTAIEQL